MSAGQVTTYREAQLTRYRGLGRTSVDRGVTGKVVGAVFLAVMVFGCATLLPYVYWSVLTLGTWLALCVGLSAIALGRVARASRQLIRWGGVSVAVELADEGVLVIDEPVAARVRVLGRHQVAKVTLTLAGRSAGSELISRIVTNFHNLATVTDVGHEAHDFVLRAPATLREHNARMNYWLEVVLDDLRGEPMTARFEVRVISRDES